MTSRPAPLLTIQQAAERVSGFEVSVIDGVEWEIISRETADLIAKDDNHNSHVFEYRRQPGPTEPQQPSSVVYFVKSGDFVKIGRTSNFTDRLAKLQVGTPHPLEVLHVVKGGSKREAEIHRALQGYHYRGEWFHYCEPLIAYFESLE